MIAAQETKTTSTEAEQPVFERMTPYNHEEVVFFYDEKTGLKAIVAIHNTVLGPALGGTRMWKYKSEAEAINDVMRLSRGMTYKASISGLNLGGGKAVIIGDSKKDKSEALLRKYGKFIDTLGGRYITAEDVGISTVDMEYVRMETKHVTGLPESMGGGGDPSPITAYGVFMGMKAAANQKWGSDSLAGKTIAVQGVGHVGEHLVKLLAAEKAIIYVSDISEDNVRHVLSQYPAIHVGVDAIYDVKMDIYAPCAMGATVNTDTINRLSCSVIAGSANNQLLDENEHGLMLMKKGIIYAPDFLINAGGLINVFSELNGYDRRQALASTEKIYQFTLDILKKSIAENIPSQQAAKEVAEKRIEEAKKAKLNLNGHSV